ncbi:hypothetical protein OZK63_25030 [Streptomyces sp. UMAF16]|nr:hypothetical protein [Streptomyces sp. UMAF16]
MIFKLVERTEHGHPMKLTAFGEKVAAATREALADLDQKRFAQAGERLLPSRQRERRVITGQGG